MATVTSMAMANTMVEAKAKKANERRIIETIAINVRNNQHLSHNRYWSLWVFFSLLCLWVCIKCLFFFFLWCLVWSNVIAQSFSIFRSVATNTRHLLWFNLFVFFSLLHFSVFFFTLFLFWFHCTCRDDDEGGVGPHVTFKCATITKISMCNVQIIMQTIAWSSSCVIPIVNLSFFFFFIRIVAIDFYSPSCCYCYIDQFMTNSFSKPIQTHFIFETIKIAYFH